MTEPLFVKRRYAINLEYLSDKDALDICNKFNITLNHQTVQLPERKLIVYRAKIPKRPSPSEDILNDNALGIEPWSNYNEFKSWVQQNTRNPSRMFKYMKDRHMAACDVNTQEMVVNSIHSFYEPRDYYDVTEGISMRTYISDINKAFNGTLTDWGSEGKKTNFMYFYLQSIDRICYLVNQRVCNILLGYWVKPYEPLDKPKPKELIPSLYDE
jgi:hypothetical protein